MGTAHEHDHLDYAFGVGKAGISLPRAWEFEVDAICVHIGVLGDQAPQLFCCASRVFSNDCHDHVYNGYAGRSLGSFANGW